MLFYLMFFSFLSVVGVPFIISYVITYLGPIVKATLIGIAAIILLPRLLSATPMIIALAALVAVIAGVKRIVGFLLG